MSAHLALICLALLRLPGYFQSTASSLYNALLADTAKSHTLFRMCLKDYLAAGIQRQQKIVVQ